MKELFQILDINPQKQPIDERWMARWEMPAEVSLLRDQLAAMETGERNTEQLNRWATPAANIVTTDNWATADPPTEDWSTNDDNTET